MCGSVINFLYFNSKGLKRLPKKCKINHKNAIKSCQIVLFSSKTAAKRLSFSTVASKGSMKFFNPCGRRLSKLYLFCLWVKAAFSKKNKLRLHAGIENHDMTCEILELKRKKRRIPFLLFDTQMEQI